MYTENYKPVIFHYEFIMKTVDISTHMVKCFLLGERLVKCVTFIEIMNRLENDEFLNVSEV